MSVGLHVISNLYIQLVPTKTTVQYRSTVSVTFEYTGNKMKPGYYTEVLNSFL